MAAGGLLVAGAGGLVTDLANGPFRPYGDAALATNGRLHPALLAAIAEHGG